METQTKSNRMLSIIALYDMQTDFFLKAIDGVSDEDAMKRLDTEANHIAWLAGSLVEQRFELAQWQGATAQSIGHDLFKHNQGIKDGADYPALQDYKVDWKKISPILREQLLNATDVELDRILDFPDMNMSFPLYDMITFSSYREANIIGQIILWRRLLGYEGIRYD